MALPVTIPNAFANATASIPLSQLDANFNTLANAVNGISDGSETLANVTATVGNITTVNATTVDTTNIEVTNIKAKDGTSAGSIADSTGVVTLASSVLTTTDINGGTIDGTAIGGASAAAGSFTTLNTSGQVVFNDAGADVDFRVEGDTDANLLFVDASTDRVGIGTSSLSNKLTVAGNTLINGGQLQAVNTYGSFVMRALSTADGQELHIRPNAGEKGYISFTEDAVLDAWVVGIEPGNSALLFKSGSVASNAERARITSGGEFWVGTTTGGQLQLKPSSGVANLDVGHINGTATGSGYCIFRYNETIIGRIDQNGTNAVSYNTSSDYRLKENIAPMTGALAKVLELKPVTYTWKVDGSAGQGFIAHELQEVAPYAVSGEKDGEEMQGVDYGKITPLLTAALQEALAKIKTLEARIAALETK